MPFVSMAPAVAGAIASSSDYNDVVDNVNQLNTTRTKYKRSVCSGDQTVTTTQTDLAGASISFTTAEANTQVLVTGVFDVNSTHASDVFIGTMSVDGGAVQVSEAHLTGVLRANISQQWLVTVATAGAHTVKLRVAKVNNLGTVTVYANHSNITAQGQGIT